MLANQGSTQHLFNTISSDKDQQPSLPQTSSSGGSASSQRARSKAIALRAPEGIAPRTSKPLRRLQGLYVDLITPLTSDHTLDIASLDCLIEFYLQRQVHGIVTLSSMGEGPLLLEEEWHQVVQRVLARVGNRVPVVVGVASYDSRVAAERGQQAHALGASALLVPPLKVAASGVNGLLKHYAQVASKTQAPLVVLDSPLLAGRPLPVSFFKRLVQEVADVCAVIVEDTPTAVKISQLRDALGQRVQIFGGLGGAYCLQELERGSDGLITGFAYPEPLLDIIKKLHVGDTAGAIRTYVRWLPVLLYEGQPKIDIALRKTILQMRKAIVCSAVRPPTRSIDPQTQAELERILVRAGTL